MQGAILVVDPLVVDRFRTVRSLQSAGYSVLHADTATAAIHCISTTSEIGTVLVEFNLPDHRAPVLLEAASQQCQEPPVFMVLMRDVEDVDMMALREMGFCAVMSKPLSLPLMERAMANELKEREAGGTERSALGSRRVQRTTVSGADRAGMYGKREQS